MAAAWAVGRNKKNQATRLKGLLALDQAERFLPPSRDASSKTCLSLLADRGPDLGLGLIAAVQNPRDADLDALGRAGTCFFGLANSPQALKLTRRLMEERGGAAPDLARLDPGQFYAFSAGHINPPHKIKTPLCLTRHTG